MSDLRTQAIEAMALAIHPEAWGSPFGADCKCEHNAAHALDALLDFLTEHADEWAEAELKEWRKTKDYSWTRASDAQLARLVAALKGDRMIPDDVRASRVEWITAYLKADPNLLREVLEGLGAETLEAWLSEDPEFGEDLWALPVESKGVYLVWRLPEEKT